MYNEVDHQNKLDNDQITSLLYSLMLFKCGRRYIWQLFRLLFFKSGRWFCVALFSISRIVHGNNFEEIQKWKIAWFLLLFTTTSSLFPLLIFLVLCTHIHTRLSPSQYFGWMGTPSVGTKCFNHCVYVDVKRTSHTL